LTLAAADLPPLASIAAAKDSAMAIASTIDGKKDALSAVNLSTRRLAATDGAAELNNRNHCGLMAFHRIDDQNRPEKSSGS
jgi:hypothetical protein